MAFTNNCIYASRLRSAGLRRTILRVDILNILKTFADQWLDVDEINKALTAEGISIPISALYRTLKDFSKHDVIMRDWRGGFSKKLIYRLKKESSALEYSIICRSCSIKVSDTNEKIHTHIRHFAIEKELTISHLPIVISIVCDTCATK